MKIRTTLSAIVIGMMLVLTSIAANAQCENDTINPWFVDFPFEITIGCGDFVNAALPIVDDNCDEDVEIAMIEEVVQGSCDGALTRYRIYRAYDDAGNQAVETQIMHVVDETAPTMVLPPGYTISCNDSVVFDTPLTTDNCSWIILTWINYTVVLDECTVAHSKLWTAQDGCGNTSTAVQTITVVDLEPPVIVGSTHIEVESDDSIDSIFVVVYDACSTATVSYTDTPVSGNNVIRLYIAIDACGNVSSFEQIIHTGSNNLVAICHRLGNNNWITIHVAQQAVSAHLNHGDYLGPCTGTNQWLPLYNLEKLPNGEIRKIVRMEK